MSYGLGKAGQNLGGNATEIENPNYKVLNVLKSIKARMFFFFFWIMWVEGEPWRSGKAIAL